MKTKVEKLGPGSWAVFVNGQRHHELFLSRAAARKFTKEAKQKEADKGVMVQQQAGTSAL